MLNKTEAADLALFSAEDAELLKMAGVSPASLGEDEVEVLEADADADGLGAVRRRKRSKARKARRARARRRLSKATRAKLRRLALSRPRTKKGRFSRKASRRSRSRRRKHSKGVHGLDGFEAVEDTGLGADLIEISDIGLGKVGRKRRRKAARKARRSRGRRRSRRGGMGTLASLGEGIGQAEMNLGKPVIGVFQWAATRPGLEALGGVALAPIFGAVVGKVLRMVKADILSSKLGQVAGGLATAVAMWEFGKLVKSPNIGKFGAFYIFGRLLETMVVGPMVVSKIPGLAGLGTMRIPDADSIGTVRIPDDSELVGLGQQRVPDDASIGAQIVTEDELLGQFEEESEEESDVF